MTYFGIVLMLLGIELYREGHIKNSQYKPQCINNDGDKLCIMGIFTTLAGISAILASKIWL